MKVIYFFVTILLAVIQDAIAYENTALVLKQPYALVRSKRFLDFLKLGIPNWIEDKCMEANITSKEQFCNIMSYKATRGFEFVCKPENINSVCNALGTDSSFSDVYNSIAAVMEAEDTSFWGKLKKVFKGVTKTVGNVFMTMGPLAVPFQSPTTGIILNFGCKELIENHLCPTILNHTKTGTLDESTYGNQDWKPVRREYPKLSKIMAEGCDTLFDVSRTIRHHLLQKGTPEVFCQELKGDYIELCEEAVQLPCSELGTVGRWICKKVVGHVFCSPKKK